MKGGIILQTLLKYLKNQIYLNKGILLSTFVIYILSIIFILLISFQKDIGSLPDVTNVYEKPVSFLKVFKSNTILVTQIIIQGLMTLGIYGLLVLGQNVIFLGLLSNSFISNSMIPYVYKMIPHGLIELFGISFSVVLPFTLYMVGFKLSVKLIKREMGILNAFKTIGQLLLKYLSFLLIIFFIAAIIEFLVSRIKFM